MPDKLTALLAYALGQAALAARRAREATDPQDRFDNEGTAQRWRALARSYRIVESLKQFLITLPKKRDLRRLQSELPSDPAAPSFPFRCPITGAGVNGFLTEESPSDDPNTFNAVSCLDCGQIHLVNFRTGKIVGEVRRD